MTTSLNALLPDAYSACVVLTVFCLLRVKGTFECILSPLILNECVSTLVSSIGCSRLSSQNRLIYIYIYIYIKATFSLLYFLSLIARNWYFLPASLIVYLLKCTWLLCGLCYSVIAVTHRNILLVFQWKGYWVSHYYFSIPKKNPPSRYKLFLTILTCLAVSFNFLLCCKMWILYASTLLVFKYSVVKHMKCVSGKWWCKLPTLLGLFRDC